MPTFTRGDVTIQYRVFRGMDEDAPSAPADPPPVLLIAPGGMRSTIERWENAPWNPITELDGFLRIAMDQRNAGGSKAPVRPGDGWASYTADQLALLDHLGLDRVQVVGMCIGGPYALGLMRAAPERIASAVLMQPIGFEDNRALFFGLFEQWSEGLAAEHPEADADTWRAFRDAMFGGDFLFNTTREEVAACQQPILVLMGDDPYHPANVSREIVKLAPNATLIERWREPPDREVAGGAVRDFLRQHA